MSLFGSTTTSTPLFGTAASTTKPLFGATTAPAAAAPATSSVPLFGTATAAPATTTSTGGGLFGATTATTAAPATGGLFGSTTTATNPAGGLTLGGTTAPATSGGLFGSTTAAPTTSGGLFGAKPATTAAPTLGGGLFGSTPAATTASTTFGAATAAPATTSFGLGGVQQNQSVTNATGATTSSLTGGEKDASKDAEVQAANFIREMLPLIENKLKKNRDLMEEVENMTVDNCSIEDMIDRSRGWICEVRRNIADAEEMAHGMSYLVANDKALLETAKRVQDQAATANQTMHAQFIKTHLAERTDIYEQEMKALQTRVTNLRSKFEKLLTGEPAHTMTELDGYFLRVDHTLADARDHIHDLGREIEELKNMLIEQGYTHLRRSYPIHGTENTVKVNEGAEFFPSQSSLVVIGNTLRAPAAAAPVGGLGLSTGTGLFGSTTGGSSLFGSTATTKPTFSGGSLFGSLTSTAPAATTTTTSSSSLFGSKPNTTFASTVSNNSSGLLFSSKK